MGTGYQEDKKEHYEKIMSEITGHPDFGKKNPVDIGIDCGYSEETVMEMIQFLYDFKDQPKTEGKNEDEREKYYFLLKNTLWEEYCIASVNINTWETEWVKSVGIMPALFRIKGAVYAYVLEHYLVWENLVTGKKETFQVDGSIEDILIADNGIVTLTERFFVLFPYQGGKIQLEYPYIGEPIRRKMLIEGKNAIYAIFSFGYSSAVWKIEKESFHENVIWNSTRHLAAVEYADEDLIWYVDEYSRGYRKYSEKSLPGYKRGDRLPFYVDDDYIIEIVSTKNYELWQTQIFGIKYKGMVYGLSLQKGNKGTYGQVIGIYEKDIFVGVREGGQDLIKIDLRAEKEPVILSVHKK